MGIALVYLVFIISYDIYPRQLKKKNTNEQKNKKLYILFKDFFFFFFCILDLCMLVNSG